MTDTCPKCGAAVTSQKTSVAVFQCGSRFTTETEFEQTSTCRIIELEAQLRQSLTLEELARRLNQMGQLGSAGDHGMCVVVRAANLADALGLAFADGRFAVWGKNPEQEHGK